jgi:hypothetical protein
MYIIEIETCVGTFAAPVEALKPRLPNAARNALLVVKPEWVESLQPYCKGKPRLVTLRKIRRPA